MNYKILPGVGTIARAVAIAGFGLLFYSLWTHGESGWNGGAAVERVNVSVAVETIQPQAVPRLSRIPYIGGDHRLFPARPSALPLTMLVTPRIIIQDEEEAKLLGTTP